MATGEGGRDEPLAVGAARQRNDEKPEVSQKPEGDEEELGSIDGKLDLLRQLYGARIETARRVKPGQERAAAIRALRRELKAATLAITTRHREEQAIGRAAVRSRKAIDYAPIK